MSETRTRRTGHRPQQPRARSAALLCASLFLAAAGNAGASRLETVNVPMRDGVTLATDVWLPDTDDGPRPVILRRTPYGRAFDAGSVDGLISFGYVFVSQDVRGRGDSAGEFIPFRDDAHDGFDTMAWIAAQGWSNGRVGTFGGSAEGIVQLLAAGEGPPAMRCAFVGVATGDVYAGMMPGGAWRTDLTTNWLVGLGEPAALDWVRAHEVLDASWDPLRLDATERARITFPILMYGGLFDIFAAAGPQTHHLLQQEVATSARADQFLLLGPWTHGGPTGTTTQGEVAFPADSEYTAFADEALAFFAWCLQDGPRPDWAAVRYYVLRLGDDGISATGEWRRTDSWPPPATPVTVYPWDDGALHGDAPPASGASADLASNPSDPIPSVGGGNLSTPAGPYDQSTVDARPDVLVAQTPAATEDAELIGDVSARIWAASATTDVDVIVRLSDVTPGGRAMLLADGIRRGRFLGGADAIRPLTPGAPVAFDIDVGPVSFVLPARHALRIGLSATSFPRYEANPGVAEALAGDPTPVSTTLTIYRDAARPSAITLPLARGTIPGAGADADADADGDGDADADADADAGGDAAADESADAGGDALADAGADSTGDGADATDGADAAASPTHGGCACAAARDAPRDRGGAWTLLAVVCVAWAGFRRGRR